MESQLAIVAEDCRGLEKSDILFLLLHQGEEEVEMSSIELLYQGILPSLPQYMVCTVFLCCSILCESNHSGRRSEDPDDWLWITLAI